MQIYSLIMGQVTSRARLKVRLSYCLSGYVSYMYLMLSKENIKGHLGDTYTKVGESQYCTILDIIYKVRAVIYPFIVRPLIFFLVPFSFFSFFKGKICGPSCWMQNFEATFAHILKLLLLIIIYYLSPLFP